MSSNDIPVVSQGELFMSPDVDAAREFFRNKSRAMTNKQMSVAEAVQAFIHDGDYLATGGFGGIRIATAALHEIVRTHKKNLGLAGIRPRTIFKSWLPGAASTVSMQPTSSGWNCAVFHPMHVPICKVVR